MKARFTQSFKIQAVEKALERANDVSLKDIADDLMIGQSTLGKWIGLAQKQKLEPAQNTEVTDMTKAKRPQDWSAKARLDMVISCASLDEEQISELCRQQGLFPHHIKQWKQDFIDGSTVTTTASIRSDNKTLRQDNKALKKEVNRKDKALAETAALLVLQKKVNAIWGNDEDDLQ
jgi:transposase-like protein